MQRVNVKLKPPSNAEIWHSSRQGACNARATKLKPGKCSLRVNAHFPGVRMNFQRIRENHASPGMSLGLATALQGLHRRFAVHFARHWSKTNAVDPIQLQTDTCPKKKKLTFLGIEGKRFPPAPWRPRGTTIVPKSLFAGASLARWLG